MSANFMLRSMQPIMQHIPANKKGKLAGYCKQCGMMLMEGEVGCARPNCYCKEITDQAPQEKIWGFPTKY